MAVIVSTMRFYGVEHKVDVLKIRCQMAALDGQRVGKAPKGTTGVQGWAERTKLSHMTWRRLIRGESITLDSLTQILAALDLSFSDVCRPTEVAAVA